MEQLKKHVTEKLQLLDCTIHSESYGEGETIVFLHGGPGDEHRYFLPHVLPLAETHEIFFYDQRGCGQSQQVNDPSLYTMMREVETLEALRREKGWDKMNLLGQSWGTMLGLLYASQYPERVRRLLLVSAVGVQGKDLHRFIVNLQQRMSPEEQKVMARLESEKDALGLERYHELEKEIIFPWYVYERSNLTRLTESKVNEKVHDRMWTDISTHFDLREKLHGLKGLPLRVIQGKWDLITPEDLTETLFPYLPSKDLVVFEQSGHWPFLEEPKHFIEAVREFFPA
ncbi:proline iminopeptidase [Marininema mesophilum]|uniref:Proline iminopeptidase n=1 Tax=Marininema mesophilum TaxID=1048340 RepID=A0A1H2U6C3_9BACL|nr:alpha/beta fold hydrolase [Marininema mesophilum]SDW51418.1 proline iminopeptidase [Marininema mesophilum]